MPDREPRPPSPIPWDGHRLRTADAVFHRPTGEEWLVAYAEPERDEVVPCGWPCCVAKISDCDLIERASDEASHRLLLDLANMSEHDMRRSWARRKLGVQP